MAWTPHNEGDLQLLMNYVRSAPQQFRHVAGRGDPEPVDQYFLKVNKEQRNMIVRALDCLSTINRPGISVSMEASKDELRRAQADRDAMARDLDAARGNPR